MVVESLCSIILPMFENIFSGVVVIAVQSLKFIFLFLAENLFHVTQRPEYCHTVSFVGYLHCVFYVQRFWSYSQKSENLNSSATKTLSLQEHMRCAMSQQKELHD